jgi:hypothetical protein
MCHNVLVTTGEWLVRQSLTSGTKKCVGIMKNSCPTTSALTKYSNSFCFFPFYAVKPSHRFSHTYITKYITSSTKTDLILYNQYIYKEASPCTLATSTIEKASSYNSYNLLSTITEWRRANIPLLLLMWSLWILVWSNMLGRVGR